MKEDFSTSTSSNQLDIEVGRDFNMIDELNNKQGSQDTIKRDIKKLIAQKEKTNTSWSRRLFQSR